MLPMACHHCNISSKVAVLSSRYEAEMTLQTCYILWHNTSIMKEEIKYDTKNQLILFVFMIRAVFCCAAFKQ